MSVELNEAILLLAQHPVVHKHVSLLTDDEREDAYLLLRKLSDLSFDEEHVQLDFIQLARLEYNLGELSFRLCDIDREIVIGHYCAALQCLTKGGFNLSMDKWVELANFNTIGY